MTGLERRIKKIEKELGGDTTEIRTFVDVVVYASKAKRGIGIGKVTIEPKFAEVIRRAASAYKGGKYDGQEHRETN